MKNKVIALTLTAVLALSSTSAFAAEANTTKVNFDFNNLMKNYASDCTNENNQYKLNVNGQTVDWNSINWKSLINTKITKSKATQPVVSQPKAVEPAPVETTPAPVETTPTPVEPAPAPVETTPAPVQPAPAPVQPAAPVTESKDITSNSSVSSSNENYEQKVVELVNIERQKNGLQSLTLDSEISNVARAKSKDMASNNYFAHQSPTYGSAGDMLTKYGIKWSAWGENIASGQRTPEAVVTAWMNSSGHRANILNTNFTKIGVGYVTNSNGTPYWTQVFAR